MQLSPPCSVWPGTWSWWTQTHWVHRWLDSQQYQKQQKYECNRKIISKAGWMGTQVVRHRTIYKLAFTSVSARLDSQGTEGDRSRQTNLMKWLMIWFRAHLGNHVSGPAFFTLSYFSVMSLHYHAKMMSYLRMDTKPVWHVEPQTDNDCSDCETGRSAWIWPQITWKYPSGYLADSHG